MSWKEHEQLVKELGIEMASIEDLRRAGVFGTSFVRRGPISARIVIEDTGDGMTGDSVGPRPERGEDPEHCPFAECDAAFGIGNIVELTPSTLSEILDRRFGDNWYLDGIGHLLFDRRRYSERELDEGSHGLVTEAPFSNGPIRRRIDRRGPVCIRRRRNGSIVISRRGHASEPVASCGRREGIMRIHRANPCRGQSAVSTEDCICLATRPFTRWLVEGEAAEQLEEALRRTDQIVEFGVWGPRASLMHATWLIGRARGRGAALWPTDENALCARPAAGTTIDARDTCIADEIRRELVDLNRNYGIEVPGRFHGDLDPASAWELLRDRKKRAR